MANRMGAAFMFGQTVVYISATTSTATGKEKGKSSGNKNASFVMITHKYDTL